METCKEEIGRKLEKLKEEWRGKIKNRREARKYGKFNNRT